MNLPGTTLVKIWTRSPAWPTKATRHGEHRCHGSGSFRLRGPLRIHAAGPAAAPVRVLRGSVMVRPSPRRLSPRNKHEIGALSAGFAIGQWKDNRVFIVVRPRDGGARGARSDRDTSQQGPVACS